MCRQRLFYHLNAYYLHQGVLLYKLSLYFESPSVQKLSAAPEQV